MNPAIKIFVFVFFPIALIPILIMWITTRDRTLMETLDDYFDPNILRK